MNTNSQQSFYSTVFVFIAMTIKPYDGFFIIKGFLEVIYRHFCAVFQRKIYELNKIKKAAPKERLSFLKC